MFNNFQHQTWQWKIFHLQTIFPANLRWVGYFPATFNEGYPLDHYIHPWYPHDIFMKKPEKTSYNHHAFCCFNHYKSTIKSPACPSQPAPASLASGCARPPSPMVRNVRRCNAKPSSGTSVRPNKGNPLRWLGCVTWRMGWMIWNCDLMEIWSWDMLR